MQLPELLSLKGDARTLADRAFSMRSRADDLVAEANRLRFEADAFERVARQMKEAGYAD
jgi:hypothetical protein